MLSILIPVYNYPVTELVNALHKQCMQLSAFEILIADDCSIMPEVNGYKEISALSGVRIIYNKENLGRAKTRNLLANNAQYDHLLFIDCDAKIREQNYIENYIQHIDDADALIGGTAYETEYPTKSDELFRWKYGSKREMRTAKNRNLAPYFSFSSFNFLIRRDKFLSIQFDESITNYGHEDTLLGLELQESGISVLHIDNPLIHAGLESGKIFMDKTEEGICTLFKLYCDHPKSNMLVAHIKLLKTYVALKKIGGLKLLSWLFSMIRPIMKNLVLSTHSLFLFDLYKLGVLCQLKVIRP